MSPTATETNPVASGDDMTVGELADAVERAARGMNQTALQNATGLSARTLRDILSGNPARRFGRVTLDKLDGPLGWAPGTAWRIYRDERQAPTDARMVQIIAAQMEQIAARVSTLEEAPSWAGEVLDVARALRPEDRARWLDLGRRLAGS